MFNRTCALDECEVAFQTDNPRKTHCCPEHANLNNVRRWRARRRKGKGGGGGGGNGGGGAPMLFEELNVDSRTLAVTLPDTCYRTPGQEPDRKPSTSVSPKSSKAAA